MDLPDLVQRLVADATQWTQGFGQAMSSVSSFMVTLDQFGQVVARMASQSGQAAAAFQGVGQAAAGAVPGINQIADAVDRVKTLAPPAIKGLREVKAAADSIRTLAPPALAKIPGAEPPPRTLPPPPVGPPPRDPVNPFGFGPVPGFIRPGAPAMPGGIMERGATALEMMQVLGRPGADATFKIERERNEALQRQLGKTLQAQQKEAQEAARASERAMHDIKMAWLTFGRDMIGLSERIAAGIGNTAARLVPFFGPILGGAIRGAGTGSSLGASAGGAIGLSIGGPVGGIAGTGAGFGLGGLAGFAIGGQLTALVQGITISVNVLETAFQRAKASAQDMVSQTVVIAMEFQRLNTAFEVFTGSLEVGQRLFADMQEMAIQTPYNLRQLADVSQTLLAMGVPADKVVESMRQIGDVASGDTDRLRRLTLAFSEVVAEGRLTGQRLRQFAAAGVGAQDFATTMGISVGQFRDMMREGHIPAETMLRTFERLTGIGGRFFDMSARQSRTVAGAWSNLIDRLEILGGKVGQEVFTRFDAAGIIQRFADSLADLSGRVLQELIRLIPAVQAAFTGLFQAVEPHWNTLTLGFQTLLGNLDLTPTGLDKIRKGFTELGDIIMRTLKQVIDLIKQLALIALPMVVSALDDLEKAAQLGEAGATEGGGFSIINALFRNVSPTEFALQNQQPGPAGQLAKDIRSFLQRLRGGEVFPEGGPLAGVGGMGGGTPFARILGREMVAITAGLARDSGMASVGVGRDILASGMMRGLRGAVVGGTTIQEALTITVSPEAEKLVEDMRKNMKEGLDPLEKFERQRQLIEEAFRPRPGFVGPPDLENMARMQAQVFLDTVGKLRATELPLPTAVGLGTKEAANAIAEATSKTDRDNFEAMMKAAEEQHKERTQQLEDVKKWLGDKGVLDKMAQKLAPAPEVGKLN